MISEAVIMAKSSREIISAARKRREEYKLMRDALMNIALATDATNADRIAAINTIRLIDAEGVPSIMN